MKGATTAASTGRGAWATSAFPKANKMQTLNLARRFAAQVPSQGIHQNCSKKSGLSWQHCLHAEFATGARPGLVHLPKLRIVSHLPSHDFFERRKVAWCIQLFLVFASSEVLMETTLSVAAGMRFRAMEPFPGHSVQYANPGRKTLQSRSVSAEIQRQFQ